MKYIKLFPNEWEANDWVIDSETYVEPNVTLIEGYYAGIYYNFDGIPM